MSYIRGKAIKNKSHATIGRIEESCLRQYFQTLRSCPLYMIYMDLGIITTIRRTVKITTIITTKKGQEESCRAWCFNTKNVDSDLVYRSVRYHTNPMIQTQGNYQN